MRKKYITASVFCALMLLTAVFFLIAGIDVYRTEMEQSPNESFAGMGAAILAVIGIYILICELNLFVTVYYFLFSRKTTARTVLSILSTLTLVLIGIYEPVSGVCTVLRRYEAIFCGLLVAYVLLRSIYWVVWAVTDNP